MCNQLYDKNEYENYPSYLMGKKKEDATPSHINTFGNQQRFGADEWKNATSFDPEEVVGRKGMDITYDGDYLTANAYRFSPEGDTLNHQTFKKRAYSGRSIGDNEDGNPMFDFSLNNQATRGIGPLPEGNYYINPQNIQRYNPTVIENIIDHIGGALGQIHPKLKAGTRPGGTTSWGNGLIDIYPNQVEVDYNGNKTIRDNFTIHGGCEPGSAGCIDLLDNDDDFFDFVDRNKGNLDSVALKVDYSKFR